MNSITDINNISMLQIEVFLRVADCGSMSESAKKLFISQSAATRWIQKLEASMNVTLFVRTSRGMTLTPEGKRLYGQIKPPYTKLNAVLFSSRQVASDSGKVVHLACLDVNEVFDVMSPLITQYENLYPDNNVNVQMRIYAKLREGMLSGKYDCAFTYSVSAKELPGMEFRSYKKMGTYFAVSSKSPAIENDHLNYAALSHAYLYIQPNNKFDVIGNRDISICRDHGFTPVGIQYVYGEQSVAALVRDSTGFSIVGPAFGAQFGDDIRLFKVENTIAEEQYIGVIWRPDDCTPETRKFVESIPYIDAVRTDE